MKESPIVPPSPEEKEKLEVYRVHIHNPREEEELLGTFASSDAGVEFLPYISPNASEPSALEEAFSGDITAFVTPKGERTYHLHPSSDKAHLSLSLIFGIRRTRKDQPSFPEIMASIGHTNEYYGSWKLSEEQWQEMDEWLQARLKGSLG
jgi:hypothetical protein